MAHRKRFPPCIHCGGQSEDSKSTTTFRANDGEIPGWDIKCGWCGEHYLAVMVPLPAHASMSGLDEELRIRRRNDKRRKFGYEPGPVVSSRGAKRIESDQVEATITIRPGHVVAALRKRIGLRHEVLTVGEPAKQRPVPARGNRYKTDEERRAAKLASNRSHMRRKRSEEAA